MTNAQRNDDEDDWPFNMPWDDEDAADAAQAPVSAPPAPAGEPSTVELLAQAQRSIDDLLGYVAELEAERKAERADNERLRLKAAQTIDGLMAQGDRQRAKREQEQREREEEEAAHLAELDEHKRRLTWLEREHEKCADVKLMLERQIGRLEDQLRACQEGRLPACVNGHENGEMVPVDGGALKVLGQQAAQTEHMRQRYQYMAAAETDDRFKPGQKATIAALVDICGVPPGREAFTAPRKVSRIAIAERTGQALSTISKQVPDLANIGLINLERRSVTKERPSDDPDGMPLRRTEEEWWISLGELPPRSVPKEEIQAKCTHAQAEAERKKRCPGCGHTTLEATSYHCTSCGRTCAAAEAQAAGERFLEQPDGAIVDLLTGEKLTPLFVPPKTGGNGHARTKPRRRARPPTDSGGGARHTTIVHPDRNPDGATSSVAGNGHTTASPPRNPDGGHATTPPCTPTGIRMGSVPNGQQGGGSANGHQGPAGPSPPG